MEKLSTAPPALRLRTIAPQSLCLQVFYFIIAKMRNISINILNSVFKFKN